MKFSSSIVLWATAILPSLASATDATLQGFSGSDCSGDSGDVSTCNNGEKCIQWSGRKSAQLQHKSTSGLANVFVTVYSDSDCTNEVASTLQEAAPGCYNFAEGSYIKCCQVGTCP